ncbi:hypothetical protein K493DRAFT_355383 [Basidiobolus meristosporus CBS 931.73]|uniref:Uncharacterized protein n=1 Tax=Basidiobolus meristosporus CBS 931.73 TaxID=1314790 RepID=A0A1Y1Y0V4_9FUNG|nr:hypothetical protein K493DRAFT_355383 [Basidiobolus meristosporus CBS 931.73]|eukprot:ORX91637.1 hypothetical protein K493DRAFT_355383 [Basidiobolus meristosporus CBS 931.73]
MSSECSQPPLPPTYTFTKPSDTVRSVKSSAATFSSKPTQATTRMSSASVLTPSSMSSECSQPPLPPTYTPTHTFTQSTATVRSTEITPTHSATSSECSQPPLPPTYTFTKPSTTVRSINSGATTLDKYLLWARYYLEEQRIKCLNNQQHIHTAYCPTKINTFAGFRGPSIANFDGAAHSRFGSDSNGITGINIRAKCGSFHSKSRRLTSPDVGWVVTFKRSKCYRENSRNKDI